MAPLPALLKTYSTRGNEPFAANGTSLLLQQSKIYSLKQHLKNTAVGGTLAGTRHANSVWTVKSSSNGITMGTLNDGIDRWTAHTDLLFAANAAPHSWIILENATLGYQVAIDCNIASHLSVGFAATEIANPFTGGSVSTRPSSIGTIGEFCAGVSAVGAAQNMAFHADPATGNFNYTHFTTSSDGQFFFLVSRTGGAMFSEYLSLIKSVNGRVADTRNVFFNADSVFGSRGTPRFTQLAQQYLGCTGRLPNGQAMTASQGGIQKTGTFGNIDWPGLTGVDALTGNHLAFPLGVAATVATQPVYRGELPDLYAISTANVGASVPTTVAQERVIAGDFIVPCNGVLLNL